MWKDEYGNHTTECINCEKVYYIEKTDANNTGSFCCWLCEDEYEQFVKDLYGKKED